MASSSFSLRTTLLPSRAPAPGPFPVPDSPFPFPFALPPPLSIAPFDWPSAPEPGGPIGEPSWRRWAWPQSRALRSRLPPPLSRQHIPPPLPPPAPRSSSPEPLWCPGSGQERAAGWTAEAGREEEADRRAGGAGGGRLPGSFGAARWLGRIPRGPGGGGRVAGPAMADNEKLDNQRLKNFKNKGRDLEVQ